jgi:hypothetical protein
MDLIIVPISSHSLQFVEAESDSAPLRAAKLALRNLLWQHLATDKIEAVLEEWSRPEMTIAHQLADQTKPAILWNNIDMDEDERRKAGIFEDQAARPERVVWGDGRIPELIRERVLSDRVRECHFVEGILKFRGRNGRMLVLLGSEHVAPVAEKLNAAGYVATIQKI